MALGVVLASIIPNADPIGAVKQIGDMLFPGFGTFSVLLYIGPVAKALGVCSFPAQAKRGRRQRINCCKVCAIFENWYGLGMKTARVGI
jgi:hypothetical protein